MNQQDTLAAAVHTSHESFVRFIVGFDDGNRAAQAPGLPNHFAWVIGHCALTMHRLAELLDGGDLPTDDFLTGDGTNGDAQHFDTESVCYASQPVGDPDRYPVTPRCIEIFEAATTRLANAATSTRDEQLEQVVTWGPGTMPLAKLILRVSLHNALHLGQIISLRQAIGLAPVMPT